MSQNLDYNDKVWGLLISMNVGDEFNIIEKVAMCGF